MCGIAGIVRWTGQPVVEREIRAMCDLMVHRGPDDDGVYVGDGAGLGMRRLSIIGGDTGHQPIANEDRSIWVVFNGEIYNHASLRRELEQRGHVFRTGTDTECLVHLYEDHGARLVDRLRGMFAFAIWDTRQRRLLLGRDRLGIKPLYYAETNGSLIFASEIKSILQCGEIARTLDWEAVGHLLTFLSTPASSSIVAGIKKLEPARTAVATAGRPLAISRYWNVAFTPDERSTEDELVERLRALLDESVAAHRVADVPIGAFLSGGVDSSAVVATLARQQHPDRVKTFSIGFEDSSFDELTYARDVASRLGTDHYDLVLRPDVVSIIEDLTWYLDEPFGDTSAIPTFMVSQLAAGHVKVVLTGDGGDEVFAGYDRYLVEARERAIDQVPKPVRRIAGHVGAALPDGTTGKRFLQHIALDGARRYLDASMLFRSGELTRLLTPDAYREVARHNLCAGAFEYLDHGADWLSALQHFDLNAYLPQDILTKVDRMTMAHSVEARPPLLDHALVEFAATVPSRFRLRDGTTKYLFKKALRGILPDHIIDRRKQGFAVPLAQWLRKDLAIYARDVLLSPTAAGRDVFNQSYVEQLLALHDRGRDLDLQLWTILSIELWCRRFLDRAALPMAAGL